MSKQTVTQQTPTTSPLSQGGILQRKCETCRQHTIAGGQCNDCQKKRLQRRATHQEALSEVPPIVHEVLQASGQQGAAILFNMDAQVDYLVTELQSTYAGVYNVLTRAGVSLNDASDEVVYRFEVPGAVLDGAGNLLPRNNPAVQAVFTRRRSNSQRALRVFSAAQP
ncbi:hypothetical protein NIES2101_12885 [Calothrix sp. HK-06]|nr:hypothetical protein NIES2101_12885 [Calothrix sp. HK-06]